jgi:ubiquinone biosynthesis protein
VSDGLGGNRPRRLQGRSDLGQAVAPSFPSRAARRRASGQRVAAVLGVFARHTILHPGDLVGRGPSGSARRATRLRLILEDLGATAIKIGQILSTRPDVVGPVYVAELSRLQDAAPPEARGVVEAVIASELGSPPTVCFASFETTPMAAASIGQAHAAVGHDGRPLVVKVRRPGVAAQVRVDLDILERSAHLLARFVRVARRYDLVGLADQFAATLRAELDYLVEAANAERFARNLAGRSDVRIPRVYRNETSTRVITLEMLHGMKPDNLGALREAGVDLPALARRCADVMLTMIFEHGFFHADPHAGNFFVEDNATIGLIDFGMVGRLDASTRDALVRVLIAVAAADTEQLVDATMRLGVITGSVNRDALLRDFDAILQQQLAQPLGDVKVGQLLFDVMVAMRRHRLRLPASLALLAKTFAMSEGLAARLDPEFRMTPFVLPYVQRLVEANERPS